MNKLCIITNGARAIIRDADPTTAGEIAKAIVAKFNGEPVVVSPMLKLAWTAIVAELGACAERMAAIHAARAEAGRHGNEVRWGGSNRKTSQTSQTSQSIAKHRKHRKASQSIANIAEKKRIEENRIEEKEKEKTIKENEKEEPPLSAAITLAGDACSSVSKIPNNSNADNGTTPPPPRARPQPKRPTTEHPDFTRFWDAYPRRVGKGAAARAFDKARKVSEWPGIERVVAAIDAVRDSDQWTRDHGAYIPHPATWLNQMRWLDGDAGTPSETFIPPNPLAENNNNNTQTQGA